MGSTVDIVVLDPQNMPGKGKQQDITEPKHPGYPSPGRRDANTLLDTQGIEAPNPDRPGAHARTVRNTGSTRSRGRHLASTPSPAPDLKLLNEGGVHHSGVRAIIYAIFRTPQLRVDMCADVPAWRSEEIGYLRVPAQASQTCRRLKLVAPAFDATHWPAGA